MFLIKVFCFIFIINQVKSLKPSHFCILPEDQYKLVKCKHYQCGLDFCSRDKKTCDYFKEWSLLLDKYKQFDSMEKNLKIFKKFLNDMNECHIDEYKSHTADVCLNKKNCVEKKTWSTRFMFKGVGYFKVEKCPCPVHFGFNCKNLFCTKTEEICENLMANTSNTDLFKQIRNC